MGKIMKKSLFAILVTFMCLGGANAATIDSIVGFGANDTFIAQSSAAITVTQLNGVVSTTTSADDETLSTTDTSGTAFEHDYFFNAVADTFFAISATIENTLTGALAIFDVEVYLNNFGNLIASGSVVPVAANLSGLTLGFNMVAGNNYAVRLLGDVGNSVDPDYTLQVSVVPVPAAIWLFGTALAGLLGFRKSKNTGALTA